MESLQTDYDILQKDNGRFQQELGAVQDDKMFLQTEIERLHQEGELREISLRAEEDRCSRIREELLNVREELNKLYLAHDLLEQQKLESETMGSTLEKDKSIRN